MEYISFASENILIQETPICANATWRYVPTKNKISLLEDCVLQEEFTSPPQYELYLTYNTAP